MKLKYINRIRANISIYSNKRTSNILEGTYKSIYKGKSMNFENLREYVINDDVKDIDWKASSRSGSLLVKQYIAEKKHNIMIVMDTGLKMDGNINSLESKKEIATYSAGTVGYLAIKNGDYIGMLYNKNNSINYKPFKYDLYSLELYLNEYEKDANQENSNNLNDTLKFLYKNIKKKMIIFVITDLKGLDAIESKLLKELMAIHDVLFININDVSIAESNLFDLETSSYIPSIFTKDKELLELEHSIKKSILEKNKKKLKRNKIDMVTIESFNDITLKIIKLLERHKYASFR